MMLSNGMGYGYDSRLICSFWLITLSLQLLNRQKTTTNYNFILHRVLLEKPVFMKLVRHILFSQKLHKHWECFFHVFLFPSLLGVISVMNMN